MEQVTICSLLWVRDAAYQTEELKVEVTVSVQVSLTASVKTFSFIQQLRFDHQGSRTKCVFTQNV